VTRTGEGPATQPYPNNRWSDREAQLHWSRFHLPYQLPHVQIFRSIRELLELLQSANLPSISALMQQEVASMIRQARFEWTAILNKVWEQVPLNSHRQIPQESYSQAMYKIYGTIVHDRADNDEPCKNEECCQRESAAERMHVTDL